MRCVACRPERRSSWKAEGTEWMMSGGCGRVSDAIIEADDGEREKMTKFVHGVVMSASVTFTKEMRRSVSR